MPSAARAPSFVELLWQDEAGRHFKNDSKSKNARKSGVKSSRGNWSAAPERTAIRPPEAVPRSIGTRRKNSTRLKRLKISNRPGRTNRVAGIRITNPGDGSGAIGSALANAQTPPIPTCLLKSADRGCCLPCGGQSRTGFGWPPDKLCQSLLDGVADFPSPCLSRTMRLTSPPSKVSLSPPGQSTSMPSKRFRSPRPKCRRESFCERKPDPL